MQKKGWPAVYQTVGCGRRATSGHSLTVARAPFFVQLPPLFLQLPPLFSNSGPPFWAHVVNSFSLALAHACPAQTSPKIIKHP
jgi:hypothetical protein